MALDLHKILKAAVKGGASDVHLKVGVPPMFRINGGLLPLKDMNRLSPEELSKVATTIMSSSQKDRFKENLDIDLAYGVPAVGRFRVNIFLQRGCVGLVFRVIPYKIPNVRSLLLPDVVRKIAEERRGLVLVTGATGAGKSTTLAAMLEHINHTRTCHVVTVEDPIEFLIRDRKSIISQREIGTDSKNFAQALRAALRQDPDVILVGEMRDLETISIAMAAAETGHLVFSTLHTNDAVDTVSRVISAYPPHQHKQARQQLATLLKAVISQRLVPKKDGNGRVPAVEVMISTARVRELILDEARASELRDAIGEGKNAYGMQTFDQSLRRLLNEGLITYEEALLQATNRDDFALRVSGIEATSGGDDWYSSGTSGKYQESQANQASGSGSSGKKRKSGLDFEIERY